MIQKMDERGKIILEALGLIARKARMTVIVIVGWRLVSLILLLIAVVAAVIILEPTGKILASGVLLLMYHHYCVRSAECAQKLIQNLTIDQQKRLLSNVRIVFDDFRIERGVTDAMMVLKNRWQNGEL